MREGSDRGSGAMFGRYVLVERLGRRAPNRRWLALDVELDRKVVLELRDADDPDSRALFEGVTAMARVSHPNVVTIHDVDHAEGQLFIAREYVEGESLARWIGAGPHPWQEALTVLRQAGLGLAAIHDAGLVHRAVRPTKLILDGRGRVCVLGLGLREGSALTRPAEPVEPEAELVLDAATDDRRVLRARPQRQSTRPPLHRAPEQLRGEPGDARADLFALCSILFQALYGVPPFPATTRAGLLAAIESAQLVPIAPDELAPGWIHRVVVRGLVADPDDRQADMHALLDALEAPPRVRRARRVAIAGAGVAALAVVAAATSLWSQPDDPCADAGSNLAKQWNPAVLRGHIGEQALAHEQAAAALFGGLEAHVEAWVEADRQLCQDREARRTTAHLHTARSACLERARAGLAALVELAETHPGFADALLRRPHAALRGLADPTDCIEAGASRAPQTARPDPAAIAEIELLLAVSPKDAGAKVEARLALLLDNDDDPALLIMRGRANALIGDHEGAREHFDRAAKLAALDQPDLAARAWIGLAELAMAELLVDHPPPAELSRRAREVSQWLSYADAMLEPGASPEQLVLARIGAQLALALRQPALAQPALDRALAAIDDGHPDSPDLVAALLDAHAAVLDLGDELADELADDLGDESAAAAEARRRAAALREP